MKRTGKPRHQWTHHSGCALCIPPDRVDRCTYCGVLTKPQEVETSRIRHGGDQP